MSDAKVKMKEVSAAPERDKRVQSIFEQLLEIEERLIPTGLHVFGKPPEQDSLIDMLRMVASFDRPESGAEALPDLICSALGYEPYDALLKMPELYQRRQSVDAIVASAVLNATMHGVDFACEWLRDAAAVEERRSRPVLSLIEKVHDRLKTSAEIDYLMRALRGEYIEPGPGADIVQNPEILPTGRNTHAINPYSVPSKMAFVRAEAPVLRLIERHARENGQYPKAIAMVLWGLDNIKTQGESVAQALWLLGVKPVRDRMNRVTDVEVISLEQLKRPRIDVVMTVSGIFRDLFGATMNLLDKAVRVVASLDEPAELNYVRRNIRDQAASEGCSFDEAAIRVFSNAPGSYGTNVNFMVMDSQWEHDGALGDLFVTRKCFAYGRDASGRGLEGRENRNALERALSSVEATYQNVDSFEIGITDVDHYYEYLGGVSKAVENRANKRPAIYLSDTLSRDGKIRSLEEAVHLETRTKTLNPKWYEGMLHHGFRGVAEIESHVSNTFGWSATADAVDDWVYSEVADTFVFDEPMLRRLRKLNPHSVRSLVARLIEANLRGFWNAEKERLDRLRSIFEELEDLAEGVSVE
jgi:magnesium chelatase subunit H